MGGREHELQDQLSHAQEEFEHLIGKKQSQAVQEAPAKKSSSPRRNVKPKKALSAPRRKMKPKKASSAHRRHVTSKKRERTRKAKSPDTGKTRGKWVKQSGVRKKCRVQDQERNPWAWGKIRRAPKSRNGAKASPLQKRVRKRMQRNISMTCRKKRQKLADEVHG